MALLPGLLFSSPLTESDFGEELRLKCMGLLEGMAHADGLSEAGE